MSRTLAQPPACGGGGGGGAGGGGGCLGLGQLRGLDRLRDGPDLVHLAGRGIGRAAGWGVVRVHQLALSILEIYMLKRHIYI